MPDVKDSSATQFVLVSQMETTSELYLKALALKYNSALVRVAVFRDNSNKPHLALFGVDHTFLGIAETMPNFIDLETLNQNEIRRVGEKVLHRYQTWGPNQTKPNQITPPTGGPAKQINSGERTLTKAKTATNSTLSPNFVLPSIDDL